MKLNDDVAKSINKRLSNLSQKLKVTFQDVATEFVLERLLCRIVSSKELYKKLVFKGGYVCLRIYNSERYTADLDAVLEKGNIKDTIELIKEEIQKRYTDGVWFVYEQEIDLQTQGEYGGTRLVFRAGTGNVPVKDIKRAQTIHFDLGYGDPITPKAIEVKTESILTKEFISWQVYPIETTVAEKLHALIKRPDFNSRSKDIYDLSLFLPKCDKNILKTALQKTFEHRKDNVPDSFVKLLEKADTTVLERGWGNAVKNLVSPDNFTTAFKKVIQYCDELIDT